MSVTSGYDLERIGAREKVTGATRFGADDARPGLAYAMLVTATVGKGASPPWTLPQPNEPPGSCWY